MNLKTKFWICVVATVGLLAWAGVETFRLSSTNQKLRESQALQQSVQVKLQAARAKHVQVAGAPDTSATPSDAKK